MFGLHPASPTVMYVSKALATANTFMQRLATDKKNPKTSVGAMRIPGILAAVLGAMAAMADGATLWNMFKVDPDVDFTEELTIPGIW